MPDTSPTAAGVESEALVHPVSYADTDAGGVVYHGRYIEMAERSRNRLMHRAGWTFAALARDHDVMLVMHKVAATYHVPAFLEDVLQLRTRVPVCKASRSVWVTEAWRADTLLATIELQIVCLGISTRQISVHPQPFVDALAPYRDAWY